MKSTAETAAVRGEHTGAEGMTEAAEEESGARLDLIDSLDRGEILNFVNYLHEALLTDLIDRADYRSLRRQVLARAEETGALKAAEKAFEVFDSLNEGKGSANVTEDMLNYDRSGRPVSVKCPELAEYLRDKFRLIAEAEDKEVFPVYYAYRRGCYHRVNPVTLRQDVTELIRRVNPNLVRTRDVDEIVRILLTTADPVQRTELNADEDAVNFRNYVFRLSDGALLDHSPEQLSTVQLDCDYRITTPFCPVFDKFMERLTGNDEALKRYLLSYMGAIFSNVRGSRLKKALFIVGPGNTGKSQFINLIRGIIGEKNCCSGVDLNTLENDRFATSQLYGRRLLCDSDMPLSSLKELATFKKLTGGDAIYAQEKGQPQFRFQYNGLICFSMNRLPSFGGDRGEWVYDRMAIIRCTNVVPPEQTDPRILDKMLKERSHIATLCVNTFAEDMRTYGTIPEPPVLAAERAVYTTENSPVRRFFLECCDMRPEDEVPNDSFTSAFIFDYFRNWCAENGLPRDIGKSAFRCELAAFLRCDPSSLCRRSYKGYYFNFTLSEEMKKEYYSKGHI